jgi:hypothetical protein
MWLNHLKVTIVFIALTLCLPLLFIIGKLTDQYEPTSVRELIDCYVELKDKIYFK